MIGEYGTWSPTNGLGGGLAIYTKNSGIENKPSKKAEFNFAGNLAFNSGNGIDFSATAGTGTSELFNDYEEGTWTPTIRFGTSPIYTSQEGVYTKVGRIVLCRFKINLSSHDNTDGSSITINLPFAPAVNDAALVTIDAAASTLLLNSLVGNRAGSGGATINANDVVFSAQDGTRLTYTDCNTSGIISGAVQYYV